jgi:hypothetical protein
MAPGSGISLGTPHQQERLALIELQDVCRALGIPLAEFVRRC